MPLRSPARSETGTPSRWPLPLYTSRTLSRSALFSTCRGKADQAVAYYARVGAALEHQRLLCSGAPLLLSSLAPPSSSGPPELRQLRADADVLWRKASAASVAIKDMVHAALAFSGRSASLSTWPLHPLYEEVDAAAKLAWMPSAAAAGGALVGSTASDAPAASATDPTSKCPAAVLPPLPPPAVVTAPGYLAYASLGPTSLLADAVRAIEATESMIAELAALEGRAPAGVGPLAQLSLVRQHLVLQLELLAFARDVARAHPGIAAVAMAPVEGDSKGPGEPESRAAPLPETPEPAAHRQLAPDES